MITSIPPAHFGIILNLQTFPIPQTSFLVWTFTISYSKTALEPVCCKKQQKSPNQETSFGNRGRLKVLNDTKLVLNEHE